MKNIVENTRGDASPTGSFALLKLGTESGNQIGAGFGIPIDLILKLEHLANQNARALDDLEKFGVANLLVLKKRFSFCKLSFFE